MTELRPTRAEIDLSALRYNFRATKQLAGSVKIMAVVKAEAYGHGLVPASRELAGQGVDYLGVSFLEEGVILREEGIDLPILVMGGLVDEQIDLYLDYNLEPTVSSVWKAKQVDDAALKRRVTAKVQLKIDTGMGRVGTQWRTVEPFLEEILRLKRLDIHGVFTHLATADEEDISFALTQIERFNRVLEKMHQLDIVPPLIHASNSGALLQLKEKASYTMIRPGIMLYGYAPAYHLSGSVDLRPVMTLKTRVVYVKRPPAGTTVGYGSTWQSPGDRWIATLPIGYGDGYPRRAVNGGWVMLRGRKCPIVGRVSMDQITVDAGEEAYLGDETVLFGGDGENRLNLWDLCNTLDAIPYEIMCGLTARVPRVYV